MLCETYKDPDNGLDMVHLVVLLPGGAKDPKLELNKDGTEVLIKYSWPKTMFTMEDLFQRPLAQKTVKIHHPSILSLKNGLEKARERIDVAPTSEIRICLPIKVQTGIQNYKISGATRNDGSQIIVANFTGYVKDYNKRMADSSVKFTM